MTQFQVTGHSPEVDLLEHQGMMEDAMLLAGTHVQTELERVSRIRGWMTGCVMPLVVLAGWVGAACLQNFIRITICVGSDLWVGGY
jgi:hypothetical protein